jgi:hypothetical protein
VLDRLHAARREAAAGTDAVDFYILNVSCLSWRIGPVVDDRNTFIFGVKINSITVPA